MTEASKTSVTVLGGGPGGYAAAFMASDLGLDVTMIDLEPNPGGVCLYRGCIPSKALLHVARVLTEAKEAAHWGITFASPKIDLDKMRAAKDAVIAKMTGGLGQLCRARNINCIQGRANFEESQRLRVVGEDGSERFIETDYTILASGSRPTTIPSLLFESPRIMNSSNALRMEDIPKSLLVVGGGYIGLELGSVYATLGAKVTIVEMAPGLLPGADLDLVKVLHERMAPLFHEILLETKLASAKEEKTGIRVTLTHASGKDRTAKFDKLLVCVGRKPNSSGLGLQATQVDVDEKGFVKVDEQTRTTDPHIFAIGDVAGEPMLAHKASHQGRVAAEILAGHKTAFAPQAIPAVVFTDPELAWCGLTEREAQKTGRAHKVARFPWGASGRAATLNRSEGLTKIISDPETDRVLGMGIVGAGAGELIAEGVLAIEMGAVAADISMSIHAHPTLSETVMETAELIFGYSTHMYRPRRDGTVEPKAVG